MREPSCFGDKLLKYALVQFGLVAGAVACALFTPYGPFFYVYFSVAVVTFSSSSTDQVKIYPSYYYYATFVVYVAVSIGLSIYITNYTDPAKIVGRFVTEHSILPEGLTSFSTRRMSALLDGHGSVEEIYGWLSICCIFPVFLFSVRYTMLRSFFAYTSREVQNSSNESVIDQRKNFYGGFFLILAVMFGYAYTLNYVYPVNGKHSIIDIIHLFRSNEHVIIAVNAAIYFSSFLLSVMMAAILMAFSIKSRARSSI
ncbi:membrane hypothetical protein [uncultured Pleomorphomonas sp.]|uniref:Uncharacterized protein n=1 Tax=uncultured Pleomorphomonas sp. TaxID=442121 RepID=A0A212LN99_9HYPH|nr:membrane hypothetical protein [uncultured Pleomorphomonas sp.]